MENDELAQHLESLQRESCYRVDAVLKQSAFEVTQRVYFVGSNGAESGPFIRKFIRQGAGLGSAYRRMFESQQIGHRFKYIPDILECYSRDDQMVVVMEHVRGETLQEAVYQSDPSLEFATRAFPRVCDAVTELHVEFDPPIIHRDLKPSNIILTDSGLALIDFGIAREYREDAASDTAHFGTREFAPPEQFGFGQTGVYSDVYSLGMVLYFCLTERIPDVQARQQGFRDSRIPEQLRQVIEKAVALDPAERFASADGLKLAFLEAVDVLGRADGQAGARASAAESPAPSPAPRPKRAGVFVAVAVAACLIAAVGIGVFIGGHSGENAGSHDDQTASGASQPFASADADQSSAAGTTAAADESEDGSVASDEAAGTAEVDIADDLQTPGPARNSFDPSTNFTVSIAGIEFQIPRCFKARVTESQDNGVTYYYAETGSSVAMIMTSETVLDVSATRDDFEANKDVFLSGVLKSGAVYEEVVSSTDFDLVGLSARSVAFRGSVSGVTAKSKMVYFYNPDSQTIGGITFGQTDNAQFDYSDDFAKVIASATYSPSAA